MNTDQRRLYLNNWAILVTDEEIKWHFGDINQVKLEQTLDFVRSVSRLGAELWGQGIGIVRLRYPRPHPSQAREIMIVNLSSKMKSFNIVISDPLVTTRLMSRIEVESAPWDEMRSILAGGASVIYSQFYSQENALDKSVVDALFQEAVNAVTYNENVTAGNGECSFSALSFEELKHRGVDLLPRTLTEALELFKNSKLVEKVMGKDLQKEYYEARSLEWSEFTKQYSFDKNEITTWELDRYLDC